MIWLTEPQIGDLLWRDWATFFEPFAEKEKNFREFEIGRGRVDFATFRRDSDMVSGIDLFELKITASYDSISQLIKYSRDLKASVERVCRDEACDVRQIPQVSLNFIARFFDHKIIDVCHEFDIALWHVEVISESKVQVKLQSDPYPEIPSRPALEKQLTDFFGGQDG